MLPEQRVASYVYLIRAQTKFGKNTDPDPRGVPVASKNRKCANSSTLSTLAVTRVP